MNLTFEQSNNKKRLLWVSVSVVEPNDFFLIIIIQTLIEYREKNMNVYRG